MEGEGPPLVGCPHLFESFSLEHLFPQLSEIRRLTGQGHRVVRYDARGTGLSQREVGDVSPTALVLDLEAVVKAAGVTRFALTGTGYSGARAIEYTVRHPEFVTHLVLWGAYGRFADFISDDQLRAFSELARANWSVAVQAFVDREFRESQEMPDRDLLGFGKLMRESVTGEMAMNIILEMVKSSDVRALLPRVQIPTLVIARETDIEVGQELALNIPDARFVVLGSGSSFVLENARPGIDAIHAFLGDEALVSESDGPAVVKGADIELSERSVRTVLFTDLVAHTEMMQRLGDERGRDVLREHERITRDALKQHGGVEIKTDGDSFMVSFASVTAAMDCAVALQRAFSKHNETASEPVIVRMGLNAGEPIEEAGDLFGSMVILASRIAAKAEGGEILVADTVRGLCSGKGFLFADRGEFVAKGFEEPVRVYEVSWRQSEQ
ncbi:MAG TPA: adenylate/guanylate cyclase domain-containing protein [Dehalococcoidia bacterium]